MIKPSNSALIKQLQHGSGSALDEVFTYLYRSSYQGVLLFIQKHNGRAEDAEDVFHDGLIALLKLARRGQLPEDLKVEAYLFSICRNLWFKQLQKKKSTIAPEHLPMSGPLEELPVYRMMKAEEREQIVRLLEKIGADCRQVLLYYYYNRMRMRDIAQLMGYASEQVAKNRKSECMKKLRKLFFSSDENHTR